ADQIRIGEIDVECDVVRLNHRAQQQWSLAFDAQARSCEKAGVLIKQAFGSTGGDIAVVVEQSESVALLQRPAPALRERCGRWNVEIRLRRCAADRTHRWTHVGSETRAASWS